MQQVHVAGLPDNAIQASPFMLARCSRDTGPPTAEDIFWANAVMEEILDELDRAIVFRRCFEWDDKILVTIGDCSHADSVVYDIVVDKTDGYRSHGARLHVLASPDLWDKPNG